MKRLPVRFEQEALISVGIEWDEDSRFYTWKANGHKVDNLTLKRKALKKLDPNCSEDFLLDCNILSAIRKFYV